jgi:hypothetical protein
MAQKETNGSNGEHISTRPPPTPSPLRFSKFFQVRARSHLDAGSLSHSPRGLGPVGVVRILIIGANLLFDPG